MTKECCWCNKRFYPKDSERVCPKCINKEKKIYSLHEKTRKALREGCDNPKDLAVIVGTTEKCIRTTLHWMIQNGDDMCNLKSRKGTKTQSELSKNILKELEGFRQRNGFNPTHVWLSKKTGCTREYVGQLLGRRKHTNGKENTVSCDNVRVYNEFYERILDIQTEEDLNFMAAVLALSYRIMKE